MVRRNPNRSQHLIHKCSIISTAWGPWRGKRKGAEGLPTPCTKSGLIRLQAACSLKRLENTASLSISDAILHLSPGNMNTQVHQLVHFCGPITHATAWISWETLACTSGFPTLPPEVLSFWSAALVETSSWQRFVSGLPGMQGLPLHMLDYPALNSLTETARFQAASLKAPSPDWTLGSSILGARNAGFWSLF